MQLNTVTFLVFFVAVILLYYLLPRKFQNPVLLLASYVFYMYTVPVLGIMLAVLTATSYIFANHIDKAKANRVRAKGILLAGILTHTGILIFFKYNSSLFTFLENTTGTFIAAVAMPLGISFITFQIIGYLVDVYRQLIPAEHNWMDYALFIGFFPVIISGPIQRAGEMMPQIKNRRVVCYSTAVEGMQRFLTGAFKKVVMADGLGLYVNTVFDPQRMREFSGLSLIIAILLYSFQLYFDFSGYSDMAAGIAKILGFTIRENFRAPYFAESISGFWERWHMSLTTWLRDYVYFPLGGSRKGQLRKFMNIAIVFIISGLWHGNTLPFFIWGILHALYRLCEESVHSLLGKPKKHNKLVHLLKRLGVFVLWSFSMIVFRAATLQDALYLISHAFYGLTIRSAIDIFFGLISAGIGGSGVYYLLYFVPILTGAVVLFDFDRRVFSGKESYNPLSLYRKKTRWFFYWFFGLSIMLFYFLSITVSGGSVNFAYGNF